MFNILKKINRSAGWGINGIIGTFKEEFMARVQFSFGLIQFILSIILGFPLDHIIIILIIWVLLVSQENMNTAVENLTDLVTSKKEHELAKRAKDSAGGAVLIISILSWTVFVLFLIERFI